MVKIMEKKYSKEKLGGLLSLSEDDYKKINDKDNTKHTYKKKEKMHLTQKSFYITKEQDAAILLKIAYTKDRKLDRSSVVREALENYLADILNTLDKRDAF